MLNYSFKNIWLDKITVFKILKREWKIRYAWTKMNGCSEVQKKQTNKRRSLHLFISCELDSNFWGNLKHIDSIAPPQRPRSSFFQHVLKTAQHIPFKINGTMNLEEEVDFM